MTMALFHGTCYNYNFLTMPFFFFFGLELLEEIFHIATKLQIQLYCTVIIHGSGI